MKHLVTILAIAAVFVSCSKETREAEQPTDPVLNYVEYVSNSPRTTISAYWGSASFIIRVKNSINAKAITMYQGDGTSMITLGLVDGFQTFTINTVPLSPDRITYYFKVILNSNQVLTGGFFTANFQ